MGSEKSQKSKKRAKDLHFLERKIAYRSEEQRILIVTEGEKTEPNYFNELIAAWGLNATRNKVNPITVDNQSGSAPRSVVIHAIEKAKDKFFDHIYCVFDRDKATTFNEAVKIIELENTKKNEKNDNSQQPEYHAIRSYPCFEYWFLLHFGYTRQSFKGTDKSKSAGDQIVETLKVDKGWRDYTKNCKGSFQYLQQLLTDDNCSLDDVITRAKRSLADAEQLYRNSKDDESFNPSTEIYIVIEKLKEIKESQKSKKANPSIGL
jgi:hypothetical protein